MWGSIPGPQDHDLSKRQTLDRLSHPGTPEDHSFKKISTRGAWLAQSVKRRTLDLRFVSLSPMLGVEIT